ncbi:hypothetical protein BDZ91DRAFT_752611 [Kalaharituber pfeilii]|nr:hypothetical protein BDZ91DRAFT_752611 [Kalaharituber pfeilii]
MAKKRTGDIEPGPTGDDSYKKLTRHELMFKYNTAAKAYPASAFPVFRDGKVSDQPLTVRYSGFGIEELGVRSLRDQTRWGRKGDVEGDYTWSSMQLVIDGSWYPRHPDDEVPQAVVKVDVHFNEHGREFESLLVVGVMGYEVEQIAKSGDKEQKRQHTPAIRNQIQSGPHLVQIANSFVEQLCDNDSSAPVNDPAGSGQCIDDTTADFESSLKPRVGWWIYEKWAPEEIAETKEKLGMRSRPQTKGRRRKPKRPNQVQD